MRSWPVIVNFVLALVAVIVFTADAVAPISKDGAKAIAKALETNKSLTFLDLKGTDIGEDMPSPMAAEPGRAGTTIKLAELDRGEVALEAGRETETRHREPTDVPVFLLAAGSNDKLVVQVSSSGEIALEQDAELSRAPPLHFSKEKLIRRHQALETVSPPDTRDLTLAEMVGQLFVMSGEFNAKTLRFAMKRDDTSNALGVVLLALSSVMILVCTVAACMHMGNEPTARPATSENPPAVCVVPALTKPKAKESSRTRSASPRNRPSSGLLSPRTKSPKSSHERGFEFDVSSGLAAVVGCKESQVFNGCKESAFFTGTLFKLDEDAFDSPHEANRWRQQEVWVGNQGVMYSHSKTDDSPVALWDGKSVGLLTTSRYASELSAQKFCASVCLRPSGQPEHDPKPTLWGALDEASLSTFLDTCQHFEMVEQDRAASICSCTLRKLESTSNDPLEGRFVADKWKEYEIWINLQGVICYYGVQDQNIAAFCNGVGLGYLTVERLAEGVTCQPFCISVSQEPISPAGGSTPGGTLKKKNGPPVILFGMPDERTLMAFLLAAEKFKDDTPSVNTPRRSRAGHSASMELLQGSGNASALLDRNGMSLLDEATL